MKKKILSLLLSVAMVLTLVTPALAEAPEGYSEESKTATVTSAAALEYALEQDGNSVEMIFVTSDVTIDRDLTINRTVIVTANLTIESGKTVTLAVADNCFGKLEIRPASPGGEGGTLTNNGTITGDGALWVYQPCTYTGSGGTVSVGELVAVKFVGYKYDESSTQTDESYPTLPGNAGKAIVTNTADGFAEAVGEATGDYIAVVLSNMYYDAGAIELTEDKTLPCSLLAEMPVTIGAGATVTLGNTYNGFYAPLTVNGTLNTNSTGENCTNIDGPLTIGTTGSVNNNGNDSNLNVNNELTIQAATDDLTQVGRLINEGKLSLNGETDTISGFLWNKNGGNITVSGNMTLSASGVDTLTGENNQYVNSVLRNLGRLQLDDSSSLTVSAGNGTTTYNAVLVNAGELQINGGGNSAVLKTNGVLMNYGYINVDGGLELSGALENYGNLENHGNFRVLSNDARISNLGVLRVSDSTMYNGDNSLNSISWEGGSNAETVVDDNQFRMGRLRDDGETYDIWTGFFDVKGSSLTNLVVLQGSEYFGDWHQPDEEQNISVTLNKYEDDTTQDHYVTLDGQDGVYSVSFDRWGEEELKISGKLDKDDNYSQSEFTYGIGTTLGELGFYTYYGIESINDSGNWNDETAQEFSVYGHHLNYRSSSVNESGSPAGDEENTSPDGQLIWIATKDGFSQDELENSIIRIDGEDATISDSPINGWTVVSYRSKPVFGFKTLQRSGQNNCMDILIYFADTAPEQFNLELEIGGKYSYLECSKPTVSIESAAALKGGSVTVAVTAEKCDDLKGYELHLKYDTNKLTATGVTSAAVAFSSEPAIDTANGKVSIVAAASAQNHIENGTLCYITFTVADTENVEACDEISVSFDEDNENTLATVDCDDEKDLKAVCHNGSISTFIPGDVKRDGKVNILDAVRLVRAAAELIELTPAEREAARVADGELINCVLPILNYLADKDGNQLTYHPVQA